MASGTTTRSEIANRNRAMSLLPKLQSINFMMYELMNDILAYENDTTPDYTAAVETIFTSGERTELSDICDDLEALIADWDLNHETLIRTEL